jgi:hypothetical protein
MRKIKIKEIRKLIKNLPSNAYFEIDISNGKIGQRSISTDIRYLHQIEIGKNNKLAWLNIINN